MSVDPMTRDDPMSRSGARWCDKHSRWECNADKPDHHASAIRGQAKCKNCVGKTTVEAKAQGRANMAAWSLDAAAELGPLNLHDRQLALIHLTAARHAVYADELRRQYESSDGTSGLVGATWVAGRSGEGVQSGEQLRGLVKLEFEERKFLAYLLKEAHAMGIATQQIELAQGQAAIVTGALRLMFEAAGGEVLPAVRAVMVQAFLAALEAGGGGTPAAPVALAGETA